jgi:hypothetical protein
MTARSQATDRVRQAAFAQPADPVTMTPMTAALQQTAVKPARAM